MVDVVSDFNWPYLSNLVRSVAMYCFAPKAVHWEHAWIRCSIPEKGLLTFRWKSFQIPMLVKQPTGDLYTAEQLCVEIHAYVEITLHFRRLKQSTLPMAML